jgi:hypothetical protein
MGRETCSPTRDSDMRSRWGAVAATWKADVETHAPLLKTWHAARGNTSSKSASFTEPGYKESNLSIDISIAPFVISGGVSNSRRKRTMRRITACRDHVASDTWEVSLSSCRAL